MRTYIAMALLPCALLCTEIVLYSQNSLYLNHHWIVQKRMMKLGLMGADEYLLSRIPLAQNQLNLGSYFGYQDVIYRHPLLLEEIEFRFKIEDQSYLDFIYNRGDAGYSGIRLSSREDRPAIRFESTEKGRFLSADPIPIRLLPAGWHHISIQNSATGLAVNIDGEATQVARAAAYRMGRFGFRAGMNGAKIDSLVLSPHEAPSFRVSFRNSENWLLCLVLNFCILFLFGRLLSKRVWADAKHGHYYWIMISAAGFICAGCWYAFDYGYYSRRTPSDSGITRPLFSSERLNYSSFEALRVRAFEIWYKLSGGSTISWSGVAARGYPNDRIFLGPIYCGAAGEPCTEGRPQNLSEERPQKARMVLFIGSSQTIGAGAENLENTFFVQVHRRLSKALSPQVPLESINVSISGYDAEALLAEYKSHYLGLRPDLVVFNLSNNEGRAARFSHAMAEFLRINRSANIASMLLIEASSPEAPPELKLHLHANHNVLRQLGEQYGVPVLPLHDYLGEAKNLAGGALWWDVFHLTPFGHDEVANWLAPQILRALQVRSTSHHLSK